MQRTLQEQLLLFRLRATRSPDVYGQLYDLYVDRIYRFVYFKVSSQELAEAITAEVFLKAWQYIVEHSVDNLNALLYQIARNLIIDHYRKSGREQPLEQQQDNGEWRVEIGESDNETKEDSLDEQIDRSISSEFIQLCLPRLRDDQREIITLRFIEEMSIGEITDILDIKKGHVRVLIHRAIKELRRIVHEEQKKKKLENRE